MHRSEALLEWKQDPSLDSSQAAAGEQSIERHHSDGLRVIDLAEREWRPARHATSVEDGRGSSLDAARGIAVAVALGIVLWVAILAGAARIFAG